MSTPEQPGGGGWNTGGDGGWNQGGGWGESPQQPAAPQSPQQPQQPPAPQQPVAPQPPQQPGGYGVPGQPPGGYGAPGQPPGGYGAPGQPPGQYGVPGQQFGAPPGVPQGGAPKKSRVGLIIGIVVLLVVLAGGAALAWRFIRGSSDELADRIPADAVLYAHLNLNPSAGNKLGLQALADRVNEAAGEPVLDLGALLEQAEMDADGISFAEDIDPWLGDQIAIFAPSLDITGEGEESFAALVAVDDEQAAADFITSEAAGGDDLETWDAGGGRTGWQDEDGDTYAVIDGGVLVIGTEDAVRSALDVEAPLSGDPDFGPAIAALPDRVVTLWVDPSFLEDVLAASGQDSIPGIAEAGATAVSVSFSDGAIDLTTATVGGTAAEEPIAAADLAELPAGGLLYARVPDVGRQLTAFLEGLEAAAAMGGEDLGGDPADVVEQSLGQSVEDIAGWLGDVTIAIAYDPSEAEGNAGFLLQAAVSDTDAAADLVDTLAEQIPPDAGIDTGDGRIELGSASVTAEDGRLAIRAGTFDDGTLGDDDAFAAAIDGVPGEPLLYVDVDGIVRAAAPFAAAGGEVDESTQQGLDIAAAFDALVVSADPSGDVQRAVIRISWSSDLEPVDTGGEPNLPDIDLGEFGSLADLLAGGGGGGLDEPALPIDPAVPVEPDQPADPGAGEPFTLGDDPVLDQLYLSCQAGDFQACDDLFFDSPVGSDYEAFGLSCGGRTDFSVNCVEEFGG